MMSRARCNRGGLLAEDVTTIASFLQAHCRKKFALDRVLVLCCDPLVLLQLIMLWSSWYPPWEPTPYGGVVENYVRIGTIAMI